jgi:hypothetical protein
VQSFAKANDSELARYFSDALVFARKRIGCRDAISGRAR